MENSTDSLDNLPLLRSKLANDGYLLLRDQIDCKLIDDALQIVASHLHKTWNCVDCKDKKLSDLFIKDECLGILLTGYRPITHNEVVLKLLHCQKLIDLMRKLFDCEPISFDTKWVRVKANNECTDAHSDFYRFAENAKKMMTVWMPLMDIPINKGPLAVCPHSHSFIDCNAKLKQTANEQKMDIELPPQFDEENAKWKSTNFKKGDLLIFDIRTVHASLTNKTKQFRVSMDTRWQPKDVVDFWNDAYVQFDQDMDDSSMNSQEEDEEESHESDNEVVKTLDFEQVANRKMDNHSNQSKSKAIYTIKSESE